MAIVQLRLPHHAYPIHIGTGLLDTLGELVAGISPRLVAAVIVDRNIQKTHGLRATKSLESIGFELVNRYLAPGEATKNLKTVLGLYNTLIDAKLERQSPVLAIGGGVVGDTAGFVAATYLRGLPLVQCPTTLLAMVDASIGGKVGVNLPAGKNLVGAFYQPKLVVADIDALMTLPQRELACGLAECVKHTVIADAALFAWLEQNLERVLALDPEVLVELVHRNVQIKAQIVMADEKEAGDRAHLNLGHTFAHAIEASQEYGGYRHGEAVSLGMVAATHLAVSTGRCDAQVLDRLRNLLARIGLPTSSSQLAPTGQLLEAMKLDKKVEGGQCRLVLPERIGRVTVTNAQPSVVSAAWEALGSSD